MPDFRTIAAILAPFIPDSATLIKAVDALSPTFDMADTPHDRLVARVLSDPVTMDHMRNNAKIYAIKELRSVSGCSLKEAKDAVEDNRIGLALLREKLTGSLV